MNTFTLQKNSDIHELAERLRLLPETIVEALRSEKIENTCAGIGMIYDLSEEKVTVLENEVTLTFLGLEYISTFEDRLRRQIDVANSVLLDILDDLALTVFTYEIMADLNVIESIGSDIENKNLGGNAVAEPVIALGQDQLLNQQETSESLPQPAPPIETTENQPPVPVLEPESTTPVVDQNTGTTKDTRMLKVADAAPTPPKPGVRTMQGDISALKAEGSVSAEQLKAPFSGS